MVIVPVTPQIERAEWEHLKEAWTIGNPKYAEIDRSDVPRSRSGTSTGLPNTSVWYSSPANGVLDSSAQASCMHEAIKAKQRQMPSALGRGTIVVKPARLIVGMAIFNTA